jgi:hypothetical protein
MRHQVSREEKQTGLEQLKFMLAETVDQVHIRHFYLLDKTV